MGICKKRSSEHFLSFCPLPSPLPKHFFQKDEVGAAASTPKIDGAGFWGASAQEKGGGREKRGSKGRERGGKRRGPLGRSSTPQRNVADGWFKFCGRAMLKTGAAVPFGRARGRPPPPPRQKFCPLLPSFYRPRVPLSCGGLYTVDITTIPGRQRKPPTRKRA